MGADRGFGFILPDGGGEDVFVHVSQFEAGGLGAPNEGNRVSYDTEPDQRSGVMRAVGLARAR
jgi:CspA family cold shock protein